MEIEIDREVFHQMMRRLSGVGKSEELGNVMLDSIRETAFKLSNESAGQTDKKVTVVL